MAKPKVLQGIDELKDEVETHLADYTQLKGDLSTLKTTAKDSIPNIVNELFTNVSNGKNLVGGAITGVDNSVVVPTGPTFNDLASAIGRISTGKKWASGFINYSVQTNYPAVTGLSFKPSIVVLLPRSKSTTTGVATIFGMAVLTGFPINTYYSNTTGVIGQCYGGYFGYDNPNKDGNTINSNMINDDGFKPVSTSYLRPLNYNWYAFE